MPIRVVCPGCWAKLSAPDSAAGTTVRCPKAGCGTPVPVPDLADAEEVEVQDAEVIAPPPVEGADEESDVEIIEDRPRDHDEDEEDRPRKKRDDKDDRPRLARARRRSRRRSQPVVTVVVGLAAVILVCGLGYAIYALTGIKPWSLFGGKASPPEGWKQYTFAEDGIRTYLPAEPLVERGVKLPGFVPQFHEVASAFGCECETTDAGGNRLWVSVGSVRFEAGIRALMEQKVEMAIDMMRREMGGDARMSGPRSVSWLGGKAKEWQIDEIAGRRGTSGGVFYVRFLVTDTHGYFAMIGIEGRDMPARVKNGFFDNIELLK